MKTLVRKTAIATALITALGLTACNSDNSSDNTPMLTNKTTTGVITGFGSIYINDVEYETDEASFLINGVTGDESMLKLGMVVTLSGDAAANGTGNAIAVEFEKEVEGIVIDNSSYATNGTLNIMGLIIHTDDDTVFESADESMTSIADVQVGNVIEVSGYASDEGNIWATRLEVKKSVYSEGDEIEVKGRVTLPITGTTFMIGEMTVNYSEAEFDDMTADMLLEDLLVEVKSDIGFNASNELVASKIELKNSGKRKHRYEDDDDEVELQGVITAVTSANEIDVNGATVILDAKTKIVHGSADTLAVGLKVKVKGHVDAAGNLVADKLKFKPTGDIEMEGKIEATDITANTITLFGLTVTLNNSTMVEDDRDDVDESELVKYNFGVDDLEVGNWVEIKAYADGSGGLIASKMERETNDDNEEAELEGKIESVDALNFSMVVAGVTVDYSAITSFTPETGLKAEVEGDFADGVFTATEAEAEVDDGTYISGKDSDDDDHDEHDDGDDSEDKDDDSHDDDEDETDDK